MSMARSGYLFEQICREFVRDREPEPCSDFPVSRGFWTSLSMSAIYKAQHLGGYAFIDLVASAVKSLAWAARARGFRLTSAVAQHGEQLHNSFDICGGVEPLPTSVGWDADGAPCEAYP